MKKKTYREYHRRRPMNSKYEPFYELIAMLTALTITFVVFTGGFLLFDYIISAVGWEGIYVFLGDLLFWSVITFAPFSILFSIFMVIKSEREIYLDYKEYAKNMEDKCE